MVKMKRITFLETREERTLPQYKYLRVVDYLSEQECDDESERHLGQ